MRMTAKGQRECGLRLAGTASTAAAATPSLTPPRRGGARLECGDLVGREPEGGGEESGGDRHQWPMRHEGGHRDRGGLDGQQDGRGTDLADAQQGEPHHQGEARHALSERDHAAPALARTMMTASKARRAATPIRLGRLWRGIRPRRAWNPDRTRVAATSLMAQQARPISQVAGPLSVRPIPTGRNRFPRGRSRSGAAAKRRCGSSRAASRRTSDRSCSPGR